MANKSLFWGVVALALLMLFTFAGCSNPAAETEYVDRIVNTDEFPYPVGTVFVGPAEFERLVGVLNETTEATNGVTHVAFRGAGLTFDSTLTIPAGKVVYVEDTTVTPMAPLTLDQDIIVELGGTLVLVSDTATSTGVGLGNEGKLWVKGLVEVYKSLTVTTNTLDVADYYEVNRVFNAVNTVIGKNVSVKSGGTLVLPADDIRLATDTSTNKFTPAEAWAAAGQGSLTITGPGLGPPPPGRILLRPPAASRYPPSSPKGRLLPPMAR